MPLLGSDPLSRRILCRVKKFAECLVFCIKTGHDENIELAVRWLKISREPWPDVLKNWEITYNFRQKTLLDKRTNNDAPLPISAYYEKWEVLSLPEGYTLVCKFFIFALFFPSICC